MYVGRIEKLLTHYSMVPMCIINSFGKVTRANKKIADVFKYDGIVDNDIFVLTGIKLPEVMAATKEKRTLFLKKNGKAFKILTSFIGEGDTASIVMSFIDMTSFENLKDLYNEEKPCIALINVDNLEEMTPSGMEESEMEVSTEVDKLIRNWSAKMGAAISRYKEHMYEMLLTHKNYRELVESKFDILDEVRKIETDMDFPVTLSIGIGIGGKTIAESEDYAQDALNLALGRGGDQAVVRNVKNFEYYGGKSQSVEKGYKGKSRVIAHAIKLLMTQSSKIFIMGHGNPDMDCFGAALGIHRIARSIGKEAYIVLNGYNSTMDDLVKDAKETEEYEFVNSDKALTLADENALAVVVDTHRPTLVESLALLEKINRTVIIDHHRRTEGALPNTLLSYMESYASSASELVSEIVQYACDKKVLSKFEADALLAGIMVDTNRFAVKAGVRTFEAAAWLKRAGADLENVRRYFQINADSFKIRAQCIANAQFLEGGIVMSVCPGCVPDAQIVNSQVADELLTVKGIKASFVAGKNQQGVTVVSARSLGDVNVQLIMEKFGGGGHFNTAGAQSDLSPEDMLAAIRAELGKKNS